MDEPLQPPIEQLFQSQAILDDWYYGAAIPASTTTDITSVLDNQHHSFIEEFWQVQQHNELALRKGKGKGNPSFAAATPVPDLAEYVDLDVDDRSCSICLAEF